MLGLGFYQKCAKSYWRIIMNYLDLIIFIIVISTLSCGEESPTGENTKDNYPKVQILKPLNDESVLDSAAIEIQASDDKGIVKVELYIDNEIIKQFLVPPYIFIWHTDHVADGSKHTIYAKAFDGDNNFASTEVVTVNAYHFQPSNLSAKFTSDSSVIIIWDDNSNLETGFELEIKSDEGDFHLMEILQADLKTKTIIDSFYTNMIYSFRLRAIRNEIKSNYSNIAQALISIPAPTDLNIVNMDNNSIKLTWTDNCSFEKGYQIEKLKDNSQFELLFESQQNVNEFVDNNLDINSIYQYRIRTKTKHNKSEYTAPITILAARKLTEEYVLTGHSKNISALCFSPDGKYLVSGGYDTDVILWDMGKGTRVRTYSEHSSWINDLNFAPNGINFASCSGDGKIIVWEINSTSKKAIFSETKSINNIVFVGNEEVIASTNIDNEINIWSVSSAEIQATYFIHQNYITDILNVQNNLLITSSKDKTLKYLNTTNGIVEKYFTYSVFFNELAISANNEKLVGITESQIKVMDGLNGITIENLPSKGKTISINTDGSLIAFPNDVEKGKLTIIDLDNKNTLIDSRIIDEEISLVRFSPDGTCLATSSNLKLYVWAFDYSWYKEN